MQKMITYCLSYCQPPLLHFAPMFLCRIQISSTISLLVRPCSCRTKKMNFCFLYWCDWQRWSNSVHPKRWVFIDPSNLNLLLDSTRFHGHGLATFLLPTLQVLRSLGYKGPHVSLTNSFGATMSKMTSWERIIYIFKPVLKWVMHTWCVCATGIYNSSCWCKC